MVPGVGGKISALKCRSCRTQLGDTKILESHGKPECRTVFFCETLDWVPQVSAGEFEGKVRVSRKLLGYRENSNPHDLGILSKVQFQARILQLAGVALPVRQMDDSIIFPGRTKGRSCILRFPCEIKVFIVNKLTDGKMTSIEDHWVAGPGLAHVNLCTLSVASAIYSARNGGSN